MPTPAPLLGWTALPLLPSVEGRARSRRRDGRGSPDPPCVYWFEDPAAPLRQRAPFGRAQQGVEERLRTTRGWQRRRSDPGEPRPRPSFAFHHPGAPTFCAYHPDMPAPIYQMPAAWDAHVDDKLRLHWLLSAAAPRELADVAPPTFAVDHALLAALEEEAGRDRRGTGATEDEGGACWFLKHRLDARRPRVHSYATAAALAERLGRMGERSWKHFLVQREVYPPRLLDGRKFVLRAHVLCVARGGQEGKLEIFLHDAPLVSEHEGRYKGDGVSAAQALVLQSGTRKAAYPLREALPALHGAVLARMGGVAAAVFGELLDKHPIPGSNDGGVLYQIYGLDFMLDCAGQAFLLEVNRTPRIATGAMGEAHGLYTELVVEALQILGVTDQHSSGELSGNTGVWRCISQAKV